MSWATARRAMWLAFLFGGIAGVAAFLRDRRGSADESTTPEWPPLTTVGGTGAGQPGTRGAVRTTISTPDNTSAATGAAAKAASPTADDGPTGAASFVNALVDSPDARPDASSGTWVEPLADGTCPASHRVKANDNSGIYHVPGGRFYDRTKAERCYASAAAAAADGYRAAKA